MKQYIKAGFVGKVLPEEWEIEEIVSLLQEKDNRFPFDVFTYTAVEYNSHLTVSDIHDVICEYCYLFNGKIAIVSAETIDRNGWSEADYSYTGWMC